MMKLSISLNRPKATPQRLPVIQSSAFGAGADDDDELDDRKNLNGPLAHAAKSSKAMQKRMEAEKRIDATVYEYDEVWDKMQEAKQRQQLSKEADATARKVFTASSSVYHEVHAYCSRNISKVC